MEESMWTTSNNHRRWICHDFLFHFDKVVPINKGMEYITILEANKAILDEFKKK